MMFGWFLIFVLITLSDNISSGKVYRNLSNIQTENESGHSSSDVMAINLSSIPSPRKDFPTDLFTDDDRRDGAVVFHIFGAIYFFALLAVVCQDYFLPSVKCICEDLKISKDVAAATFMAIATIAPEFSTNIIASFVIDSDVGLGGILGSLLFNVLGVASFAGMATTNFIQLDWWPITRDSLLYAFSVLILIFFTWDGQITLAESAAMMSLVSIYVLILLFNTHLMHCMKWVMEINLNCCQLNSYDMPTSFIESNLKSAINLQPSDLQKISNIDDKSKSMHGSLMKSSLNGMPIFVIYMDPIVSVEKKQSKTKVDKSLWICPKTSKLDTLWWIYTWPIKFLLTLTIPNPKTYRQMYPLTFFMCIIWIGINSYMIVWMLSIIGETFQIPEAIMGLTFLAAGNCTPEALSSIIMIRKGEKGFGVSNSLGSSSLNIFLALGVPWFIQNLLRWNESGAYSCVQIRSNGIELTVLLLFVSVVILYTVFSVSKYRLSKSVGFILLFGYFVLINLSVLFEMGTFF